MDLGAVAGLAALPAGAEGFAGGAAVLAPPAAGAPGGFGVGARGLRFEADFCGLAAELEVLADAAEADPGDA